MALSRLKIDVRPHLHRGRLTKDAGSPVWGYALAGALSALAIAASVALNPTLDRVFFPVCLAAVALSAWYGGLGPGLAATAICGLAIDYLFDGPRHSLVIHNARTALDIVLFLLASLILNGIHAGLRAETARAERSREAAEAAAEDLSRLAALVQASDDAIIGKTLDGMITSWNPGAERLYGYTAEEAIGQHITLIAPPERTDEPAGLLERIKAGERVEHYETVRRRKDGSLVDVSISLSPVTDRSSNIVGAVVIARDISRWREADRLKSQLVAMASHELRAPLTAIRGYVEMLLDGAAGELNATQHRFISVSLRAVERLIRVTEGFLDLSRLEAGRLSLDLETVDLADTAREATRLLQPQLDAKQQRLECQLGEPLPVLGDRDRLVQVVTNLVSNANKYTPSGGTIIVSGHRDGDRVVLDVQDTGIGMNEEERAQLFTRFFRARNPAARGASGAGLGLAITRSLVDLHGGWIAVRSEPGRGSTFSVSLPARGAGALEPKERSRQPEPPQLWQRAA